ncbi:MAG: hypothetical protein ACLRZH_18760 [Ruthenibacterium lactatiformans]
MLNEMFVIARNKLPSCGALNYLHDGFASHSAILRAMTILSTTRPQSAHQASGHRNINDTLRMLGQKMTLNRLLFDRGYRPAALKIISRRGRQGCRSNVCTTARPFPGLPAKIC